MTVELLIEARTSQEDELIITMQMQTIQEINLSCVLPKRVMFPLWASCHSAGKLLLQLVVVSEVLNFSFFVACCLLSWDQSAHLTCCAQLVLAVPTDLLPVQVDELVMIHTTLATWFPVLVGKEKIAKSYTIKKGRRVSVEGTIKSILADVMGTLPCSMISLMTALENTIKRVTLGGLK